MLSREEVYQMREYDGFKIEDLNDGIYLIKEPTSLHMYLVVGNERAALIDTGVGVGDLRGCVESITDKPVITCLTHYHHDHAGGAANFEQVYMSSKDAAKLSKGMDRESRLSFIHVVEKSDGLPEGMEDKLVPDRDVKCIEINPGEILDLGGRTLEVVDIAGHTPGSVGYFDNRTGLFSLVTDATTAHLCGRMTALI